MKYIPNHLDFYFRLFLGLVMKQKFFFLDRKMIIILATFLMLVNDIQRYRQFKYYLSLLKHGLGSTELMKKV